MPRHNNPFTRVSRLALCVLALTQFIPAALARPSVVSTTPCHGVEDSLQSQFQQDTHQIPFRSPHHHASDRVRQEPALVAGQDLPDKEFTLKHVLHHGGVRFPGLYRRLDLTHGDVALSELASGASHTHRVKVKATTALRPADPSYRKQGFRSPGMSLAPDFWTSEPIPAPDVTDKETVIQFAKLNYNAYSEVGDAGWFDLGTNWTVNSTFGWEQEGIRGHVYAAADNTTLLIAIKGTTAAFLGGGGGTSTRDKINDNRLFSCCCASVDRTWRPVCDCNTEGYNCDQKCVEQSVNSEEVYYDMAMALHDTTQDLYPNATVWMTGHSLGGGLASLVGLTFGTPTVTFQMPGDRLAAQRLHLPMPPAIDWNDIPLFHFGHTADPVFQGVCNGRTSTCYLSGFAMESKCHTGRTCVYDPVKEDNWGVDIRKHRLMDTIEGVLKVKEVPVCKVEEDCEDCKDWTFKDDDEEEDTD